MFREEAKRSINPLKCEYEDVYPQVDAGELAIQGGRAAVFTTCALLGRTSVSG